MKEKKREKDDDSTSELSEYCKRIELVGLNKGAWRVRHAGLTQSRHVP